MGTVDTNMLLVHNILQAYVLGFDRHEKQMRYDLHAKSISIDSHADNDIYCTLCRLVTALKKGIR